MGNGAHKLCPLLLDSHVLLGSVKGRKFGHDKHSMNGQSPFSHLTLILNHRRERTDISTPLPMYKQH